MGIKTTIMVHQVIKDFNKLEDSRGKIAILNTFKGVFYELVNLSSDQIFVFERQLKKHLRSLDKVKVLPHMVPQVKKITKAQSRKLLGWKPSRKYVLYFGYLAPYKGVDSLIANWPKKSKYQLVVAGGMNPNHAKSKRINTFVTGVNKLASKKDIIMTGFVPEKEIDIYFSAADAVILPYKLFMSSSGPLALAFAHKKPVLLSKALKEFSKSPDFIQALRQSGISKKDILFVNSKEGIINGLDKLGQKRSQLTKFSSLIKSQRTGKKIAYKANLLLNSN